MDMEIRTFKNKENVSLLGFGTMRLPRKSEESSEIDFETGQQMVDFAIENGINYFDTAYMYHDGHAETFIGEALKKHPRDGYFLATKMPSWRANQPSDIEKMFEEQLLKCQTDYFDFYLIHNINEEVFEYVEKFHVYDFLKQMQAEGKIRRLGFSFHDSPEFLKIVLEKCAWDFVQIQLNYFDWTIQNAKAQYEMLSEKQIPIIVMEPVRGGSLATLSKPAVDLFKKADPTATPASWAIRYAATFPNVLTVLSGMSDMTQLKDNIKTLTDFRPLSDSEHKTIEEAVETYKISLKIPCTYCRYCMDCPSGVHIPKVFDKYNQYFARGDPDTSRFLAEYAYIGDAKQAHQCTQCGVCIPKCPQGIDIPKELEKIDNFAGNYSKMI